MTYIYHYHATYQENYDIIHYDGIIKTQTIIDGLERIKEIKEAIDKDNADKLVIQSLSLLHTIG